jgi:hypothetical protein
MSWIVTAIVGGVVGGKLLSGGGGGSTTYNMPAQQNYSESMKDALNAQIDLAPDMYLAESDQESGRPAYARLNQNIMEASLIGDRGVQKAWWADDSGGSTSGRPDLGLGTPQEQNANYRAAQDGWLAKEKEMTDLLAELDNFAAPGGQLARSTSGMRANTEKLLKQHRGTEPIRSNYTTAGRYKDGVSPERAEGSPGMVSLIAGERERQFATGEVGEDGIPIIEKRAAGFDQSGNFLGLDSLGKDLQSDSARRQRAEDFNAMAEYGERGTELYRDQGNIRERLEDATKLGQQSAIPEEQIDAQKNQLIQLANSQGYDKVRSPLSVASEQPAGRDRRMMDTAMMGPAMMGANAVRAGLGVSPSGPQQQGGGQAPPERYSASHLGQQGMLGAGAAFGANAVRAGLGVNPSDPAQQGPTNPETGLPWGQNRMAQQGGGQAQPPLHRNDPPADGRNPAPRQPSPVEDLDRPTIGFEPWLMGSQQLAPGIDRVADPRPARDTQFFGGIQDVDASQVDSRDIRSINNVGAGDIGSRTVNAGGIGNMAGLRSNLVHGANADLALGGDLSMRERRALEQASRGASSARGRGRDFGAVVDEVGALEGARRQREMERKQFASDIAGQEGQFRQAEIGTNLQGQMANQASFLQKDLANQQTDMQGQLANQSSGLQAQLSNQRTGLQALQGNQQVSLQSQMANQQADISGRQQQIAATQANQGADLQSGQMGLQASLANQGTQMGLGQMDMQAQMANQQARQSQDRLKMGALEKDIDRGIATGELNERLRQSGLTADRGYATQLVGLEQSTSADPSQAVLGRPSGAGVTTGQSLYGNAAANINAGPRVYNPQSGLGFMQDQYNTMANLEIGRMGSDAIIKGGEYQMYGNMARGGATAYAGR